MADWTDEVNMLLDINDPARSKDAKAWVANTTALAEGAAGAPDIIEVALSASLQTKINNGANGARLNAPTAGTTTQQKVMGDDNLSAIAAGIPEEVTTFDFGLQVTSTAVTAGTVTFESAVTLDLASPADVVTVTRKIYVNSVAVFTHVYSVDATSTTETDDVVVVQGDLIYSTIAVAVTSGTITSFTSANNIKTGNAVIGVV
jgi:hypothetical protein